MLRFQPLSMQRCEPPTSERPPLMQQTGGARSSSNLYYACTRNTASRGTLQAGEPMVPGGVESVPAVGSSLQHCTQTGSPLKEGVWLRGQAYELEQRQSVRLRPV